MRLFRMGRPKRRALAAAAAIALGLGTALLFAQEAAPVPTYVVRGDYKIGRYQVKLDGTLYGAIRAFGTPLLERSYDSCLAGWPAIGLRILFYNLGGQDPCLPQYGYFSFAVMTGRHWRTGKGLRIGDPERRLFALYSPRERTGAWWWLVTRRTLVGDCPRGCFYPGLEAKVHNGWVVALRVNYPAGGD